MKQQQKRVAGVYLDSTKAVVIRPAPDYEEGDYIIQDKIEAEIHDRSGDKDSRKQAKQSDLLKYYKSVAALLMAYEEIYIFGPGNAQEQFQNPSIGAIVLDICYTMKGNEDFAFLFRA